MRKIIKTWCVLLRLAAVPACVAGVLTGFMPPILGLTVIGALALESWYDSLPRGNFGKENG